MRILLVEDEPDLGAAIQRVSAVELKSVQKWNKVDKSTQCYAKIALKLKHNGKKESC